MSVGGSALGELITRPAGVARKREVSRALAAIADQVAHLPEPYVRALQPVLLQAQAELARDLKAWLADAPDGAERFTAQHYRNALLQTRQALETMEKRVPIGVEGTLRAMGVASGELATRHLHEEVAVFAGVFGHSVRPLQIQQAAIVAEGREQLIPRFRASARRYGKDIAGDIRAQMALGLAKGETFAELTDRLQRHGGPRGLVSLAGVLGEPGSRSEYIAEGLFAKYRGWAARVVRTEGNHAYNAHAIIGIDAMNEDDPGYQKRWDATNDLRTCLLCAALDGTIRDIDKPFPGGVMHPPRHPNDRCGVTPWRPEWGGPPVAGPTKPPVIETKAPPPAAKSERASPSPVPRLDAASQATLDAVAKGGAEGLREARLAMIKDFSQQGLHFCAGASNGHVDVDDRPGKVGAAAYNDVGRGAVVFSPDTARRATSFANRWKSDPEGTRALLVKAEGTPGTAYYMRLAEMRNRADAYEASWRGLSKAKRAKIEDDLAAGRDTEGARMRREHLAEKKQIEEATAQARVRLGQSQLVSEFQAYRAVVHEEYHSFGPAFSERYGSGYEGAGAVIEEVATETLARRYLERFGAPVDYMRRSGGSYQKEIDGVVGIVRDELKLDDAAAWERLKSAADGYKRQQASRDQWGADGPHGKLAEQLAGGDADLRTRIFEKLDKLKLGKEGG